MKMKVARASAIALLCSGAASALADESVDSIEQQAAAAWLKHSSIVATVNITGFRMQGEQPVHMEGAGQYELLKKDGRELARMQVKSVISAGEGDALRKIHSASLVINDGEFQYSLLERMGRREAYKDPAQKGDDLGGKRIFDMLRARNYNIAVLPPEKLDDRDVFVVEGTPKEPDPAAPEKSFRVYIDQEHGLALKTIKSDPDGKPAETFMLSDVRYDVEIDPARFVFEPPAGTDVRDRTGD